MAAVIQDMMETGHLVEEAAAATEWDLQVMVSQDIVMVMEMIGMSHQETGIIQQVIGEVEAMKVAGV